VTGCLEVPKTWQCWWTLGLTFVAILSQRRFLGGIDDPAMNEHPQGPHPRRAHTSNPFEHALGPEPLRAALSSVAMFSARNAWLVLSLGIVLAALSAYYVRLRFAINTNFDLLISKNLPWMEHRIAFQKAFPGEGMGILAVLDAPTPELAQDAAARLTGRLNQFVPHILSAQEAGNAPSSARFANVCAERSFSSVSP
jgi:predicted RND superfamily exporter protein